MTGGVFLNTPAWTQRMLLAPAYPRFGHLTPTA
jgi:hypothetical protein